MTLLVQTDGRVKQRKARRKAVREQLLNGAIEAALDAAFAEVERIQTPLVSVTVNGSAPDSASGGAGPGSIGAARVPLQMPDPAPAAAAAAYSASMIISDSNTRAIVEQTTAQMHKYYREEFRQVLRAMAGRLQVQMEEKDDQDLVPDSVLEKLRRLVPSEFLVAWAVWTAAVDMVNPDKLNETVQWVVWAVYGAASFVYVLLLLLHGRWQEECNDCRSEAKVPPLHAQAAAGVLVRVAVSGDAQQPEGVPEAVRAAVRGDAEQPEGVPEAGRAAAEERGCDGRGHGGARERGGGGKRMHKLMPGSPSTWGLCFQALGSTLAFMLISAATGDVYLQEEVLMWTLMAATPLFALFAQFVVPGGIMGGPGG